MDASGEPFGAGVAEHVADLTDFPGDEEPAAGSCELVVEVSEHRGGGHVDHGDGLEVGDECLDVVGHLVADGGLHVVGRDSGSHSTR